MSGKAQKLAMLAALTLTSATAAANNFSYNNLDFSVGASPSSLGTNFTTQFTDNSHFVLGAESQFDGDWILTGGIGFNGPVNQFADIYGHALLQNVKEGNDNYVGEDFVTNFAFGARVWFVQNVEAYADVGQLVDGDDTRSTYNVGFRFHSTQQLVMGGSLRRNGIWEGNQVMMNVRFQY